MSLKSRTTREFIVSVAQKAFANLGFTKTTIDDVARLSKKGRRTIYIHFPDKRALYNAVVEKEINEAIVELSQTLANSENFEQAIQNYASLRMKLLNALLEKYTLLREDFITVNPRVSFIRKTLDRREFKIIYRIIEKGQSEQKITSNSNKNEYSRFYLNLLKSLEQDMVRMNNNAHFGKRLNINIEIFIKGITS